ncbi:carbohydrate ABC transporter permease [Paenibacillus piri]|uniref:Carbohydrate ABC transporter permease n=1 Tax=Paenibacillus piri TaxID=2547395 RepID=A0A4R5KU75_9BACL|nr:carbohydrate ABC transporter permease [Paenibacillus piri]TDF99469.1 carbohydrate ABC transporter permease [Paenibacillus piri]
MNLNRYAPRLWIIEAVLIVLALGFLSPFYFVLVNSFKTYGELLLNAASLPNAIKWVNYTRAWDVLQFGLRFKNTVSIVILANIGLVVIASMTAYRLIRKPSRINKLLFSMFIAAMVIPFQAIMIPLVKVAAWTHLLNSIPGAVVCYLGLGVSLSIFLFQGYVKSVPLEIEESATMDGCTPYGIFWRIIFPLLKPMTVTVILLNTLWIWNDFLLSLIILQKQELRTIQVAINSLFAEYTNQWDLALAALTMSVIPLLAFFLLLQRQIIAGIMAGSVKG